MAHLLDWHIRDPITYPGCSQLPFYIGLRLDLTETLLPEFGVSESKDAPKVFNRVY